MSMEYDIVLNKYNLTHCLYITKHNLYDIFNEFSL